MSLTLIITKQVNSGLYLKNPTASSLINHFGENGVIDMDGLDWLRGLWHGLSDKHDKKIISKIIYGVENGYVYDLRSEY